MRRQEAQFQVLGKRFSGHLKATHYMFGVIFVFQIYLGDHILSCRHFGGCYSVVISEFTLPKSIVGSFFSDEYLGVDGS